jgi:hypothetical protein
MRLLHLIYQVQIKKKKQNKKIMMSPIFCDVTPCSLIEAHKHFRGTVSSSRVKEKDKQDTTKKQTESRANHIQETRM